MALISHDLIKSLGINKKLTMLLVGSMVMILSGIGQDFISSLINHHSFYLSESSLYKTIWLLYLPLLPIGNYISNKINQLSTLSSWVLNALFFLFLSFVHICLASLFIHFLSALLFSHTYTPLQAFRFFVADQFYLIWMIYMGFPLLQKRRKKQNPTITETAQPENYASVISIKNNGTTELIDVEQIIYITSDRPYIAVITNSKKHLHQASLKSIIAKLDQNLFYRVHRSTIINIKYISRLHSRSNGDYDIEMKNGEFVRMSRNYSQELKSLIK
ncbi:MAG: LytTR family transcriptional regulator [Bacteroidetes bacterium]|nr:LytTR family transcriptional regulator [Bacteroidota bacterium]